MLQNDYPYLPVAPPLQASLYQYSEQLIPNVD